MELVAPSCWFLFGVHAVGAVLLLHMCVNEQTYRERYVAEGKKFEEEYDKVFDNVFFLTTEPVNIVRKLFGYPYLRPCVMLNCRWPASGKPKAH
jgi:hypothetical protein